jgi:hypothetical protein
VGNETGVPQEKHNKSRSHTVGATGTEWDYTALDNTSATALLSESIYATDREMPLLRHKCIKDDKRVLKDLLLV